MRIDSHHSHSAQYPLGYLETILKRNRFEKSILVGPLQPTPAYVAGIIVPLAQAGAFDHPKLRGVQIGDFAELPGAAAFGLPIDLLHLLPRAPEIAAQYPDLAIVIAHLGFPATDTWPADLERAAQFPNVYCKLSGLNRFGEPRPYVQHALSLFGPARLMFGSDWPNGLPEYTWKTSLAAFTQSIGAQPIEVREQLLGGTAQRCYRLDV